MKEFSKFDSAEESPGFLLWQVSTLWRRHIQAVLTPLNLTHTQYVILAVTQMINTMQAEVTQQDISNVSLVDVMTISTALLNLEKKGFILRKRSMKDSRANAVFVTEEGRHVLSDSTESVEKADKEFFNLDKKDNRKLISILNLLAKLQ